ncbi:MAG: S8 family serine peptidase [Anaerolineales bacterium]|nr:S8 family serine peptidase [Anaerolineales bacterium]
MRKTKLTSALTTAFLLALFVFTNAQPVSSKPVDSSAAQSAPYPYVPDVILLEVQAGITLDASPQAAPVAPNNSGIPTLNATLGSLVMISAEPLFQSIQARKVSGQNDLTRFYRVQLGSGADVPGAAKTLAALPEVTSAEPDYIAFPAEVPASEYVPSSIYSTTPLTINDPLYAEQWGLTKINIEGGWSSTVGSPTVSIAIVDSGIDLTHVDLAGNLWINPGEIANNGLDDDSNGFIDDVNGWNFVSGNKDIADDNGHGTLVTGVAAAVGGNAQGIVGACPQCSIMTVKVMQASGTANYSDVAAGILYAAQKGAKVINLSLGGYANSNILKNAIDTAANTYGAVIVAGAGNDNLTTAFYPAAYDNVLAVAGTQNDDTKAATSNYASWVDVSAPGAVIKTTALGGGWVDQSGTSFAAPFASGLAGLLRTLHPDWGQATIRSQIVHTADNINGVNPTYIGMLGSGRINAGGAMQTPHPVLRVAEYSVNGLTSGRPILGASSSMIVTLNNDWWDSPNVTGTLSTTDPHVSITNGSASFGTIPAGTSSAGATAFTFSVNALAGYNHPISFSLNVADTNGYATTLNFTVNTETGVTNKSGTITADETWTSDQTYLITNNVGVAENVTLTIQPGTTVKFNGNYYLNIGGTLIADGTLSQPIHFKSNTGGTWEKINFEDISADAVADGSGNYTSGSILRYVNMEGASAGITCNLATPYLSHVTLNSGGITCSLGATPLWLMDNSIPGAVSITGDGNAYRNTASGLSISGAGIAEDNVVHGTLSLGSGTARNTVNGITIGGSGGTLDTNTITGNVNLGDSYTVSGNTITGSLTTGNGASVDHNTVSNGITVGSTATVTWNNVENSNGTGLTAGSGLTAHHNRLIGNTIGMVATDGTIEYNLIANNTSVGLQVGAARVRYNTFTGNKGNTIVVQGDTPLGITSNNLEGNTGTYDLYIDLSIPNSVVPVPAQNNWWGTTNTTTIGARIFDYLDDFNKEQATFAPILTAPDQTAPGYVRSVTVLPDTTLGIQTGTFQVQFSKPMDTNYAPSMEFYSTKLGTWSQYNTSNSGLPSNNV